MWTTETLRVFLDDLWARFRKHVSNASAHHTKYTNAEAVAAADASNKFIERDVTNNVSGTTLMDATAFLPIFNLRWTTAMFVLYGVVLKAIAKTTGYTLNQVAMQFAFPQLCITGTDGTKTAANFMFVKNYGALDTYFQLQLMKSNGNLSTEMEVYPENYVDITNKRLKNQKNHSDASLSGTPKVIEILIAGTPYYYKVYPTKA